MTQRVDALLFLVLLSALCFAFAFNLADLTMSHMNFAHLNVATYLLRFAFTTVGCGELVSADLQGSNFFLTSDTANELCRRELLAKEPRFWTFFFFCDDSPPLRRPSLP